MTINFARLTIYGLLFFSGVVFANTNFEKRSINCGGVLNFTQTELPPGFGLSIQDIQEATNLPLVSNLAMAMEEAIRFLASLKPDEYYGVTSDYLQIQARLGKRMQVHNLTVRTFPKNFYDAYLAAKEVNEEVVTAQFQRLSIHFSEAKISDEALLVLAFASRSFFSVALLRDLQTDQILQATNNFIRKTHVSSHLPIFRDLFAEDSRFVALADYVRYSAMKNQGLSFVKDNFRLKLTNALSQVGSVPLEVKVRIALDLIEPTYRPNAQQAGFAWLLAPGSNVKKIDKWINIGSPFLTYRILLVIHEMRHKNFTEAEDPFNFVMNKFMESLSDNPNSREYKFFAYALTSIWMEMARIQTIDPQMFHQKMKAEVFSLSLRVRTALNESQRQKEQSLRQAQAEQAKTLLSAPSFKRKGEREIYTGGISKKGRVARQERLRAQGTLLPAMAVVPVRLNGALPISEIQVEGALVYPDRPYYFEKFQSSFGARDQGLAVENVQYIRLTETFLSELRKKQQPLTPWIRHFLSGTAASLGANGIKRLKSGATLLWEIKITSSGYRVIVQQDKATRVWTWLALVPHDKVDEYRMNHQL